MDLKELLGEELYNKVVEKLGDKKIMLDDGNFIPKARFDKVNEDKADYKKLMDEYKTKLDEVTKNVKDVETLQANIDTLKTEHKEKLEQYDTKLKTQAKEFAVEKAILSAKGKNPKAIKALLKLEAITLDGDNIIGLEDQLKALKESESYLFGDKLTGTEPNFDGGNPPAYKGVNPWKKESLNLTEQARIYKEDPDLAKKLMALAKK